MSSHTKNLEYKARLNTALFKAVLDVSLDPQTNVSFILTGEAIDAAVKMISMLAATSSVTSSPTKTREFTEMLSKRMRKLIAEAQKIKAQGG